MDRLWELPDTPGEGGNRDDRLGRHDEPSRDSELSEAGWELRRVYQDLNSLTPKSAEIRTLPTTL
jgi:hypothetical protein